jgi:carboxyl-terminal processing protease
MMRKRIIIAGLFALVALPLAALAGSDTYRQLDLFGRVFERIRSDYVEEVGDANLVEAAINGMLRSLDPHSSYLNPKTYRDMQVQTRGEFGGLGIEVTMENGLVKVISPIDGTPAAKAGIKAGDLISHLDGEPIMGLSLSEAVEKMRGPVNSTLKLMVRRAGIEKPFEVNIVRAVIRVQSVRFRAEKDIAYVRITSFSEQTEKGLNRAMEKLKAEIGADLKGVILDLRNNPGGLLDQAVAVSDAFLERGEIVSTRSRKRADTQRFNAREGDLAAGMPMVVLINGGSASASEIVAGALQDHQRATVIGTRSFGKGSVQTIIPLQGDGAIRLTTSRYYTPSGRSIQAKGISPNIVVILKQDSGKKPRGGRSEADLRKHLKAEDNGDTGDEVKTKTVIIEADAKGRKDYQLGYALDLLRGEVDPDQEKQQ